MKTELGKVEEYEILLENPTPKEVIVNSIISNPGNFEILPETISNLICQSNIISSNSI